MCADRSRTIIPLAWQYVWVIKLLDSYFFYPALLFSNDKVLHCKHLQGYAISSAITLDYGLCNPLFVCVASFLSRNLFICSSLRNRKIDKTCARTGAEVVIVWHSGVSSQGENGVLGSPLAIWSGGFPSLSVEKRWGKTGEIRIRRFSCLYNRLTSWINMYSRTESIYFVFSAVIISFYEVSPQS